MGKTDKLVAKARSSPKNLSFDDLCLLAVRVGFVFRNQRGSHKIYVHSAFPEIMMNFQSIKGKAKFSQVQQLISFIDEHPSLGEDDEKV